METTEVVPLAPAAKTDAPALRLSERAVAQVKEIIRAQKYEGYFLTIRVVPAGCNGLGYDLNLFKETKPGDITWEQDGIRIATDAMSRKYLAGTEIDYASGLQGAGFKFQNPNARSSCGCGTSFST